MHDIEYDRSAEQELDEAFEHLRTVRSAADARALLEDVAAAEQLILQFPHGHPRAGHGARRIILRRFSYQLVYVVEEGVIRIYAVAHLKRRPRYWRGRVK